jgi:hypothetical protein
VGITDRGSVRAEVTGGGRSGGGGGAGKRRRGRAALRVWRLRLLFLFLAIGEARGNDVQVSGRVERRDGSISENIKN